MNQSHPFAGKTVRLKTGLGDPSLNSAFFHVEGRWIDVVGSNGESWELTTNNPACAKFRARTGMRYIGQDSHVLYGKVDGFDYLIHDGEILFAMEKGTPA